MTSCSVGNTRETQDNTRDLLFFTVKFCLISSAVQFPRVRVTQGTRLLKLLYPLEFIVKRTSASSSVGGGASHSQNLSVDFISDKERLI